MELIVLSFATLIGWELVRYFFPGNIPVRIAPLIVGAIAYGFTYYYHPSVILAFAAAGVVAVIHKYLDVDNLNPLHIPSLVIRKAPKSWPPGSARRRLPQL